MQCRNTGLSPAASQPRLKSCALPLCLCPVPSSAARRPTCSSRHQRCHLCAHVQPQCRTALSEGFAIRCHNPWCVTLVVLKLPFLAEEINYSLVVVWAKEMLKLLIRFQHHSDTVVLVPFPGTLQFTSVRALCTSLRHTA